VRDFTLQPIRLYDWRTDTTNDYWATPKLKEEAAPPKEGIVRFSMTEELYNDAFGRGGFMARKDVKLAIAEKFLTGDGLEVAQRILEAMVDDELKAPTADHDTLESLYALRRDLRKLKEAE
jgi:hypothetical protein